MRLSRVLIIAACFIFAQSVFADDQDMPSQSCETIAKLCLKAGYSRHGSTGKMFWKDCMKPLILGQTVSGVKVDPKMDKACRMAKIKEMQQELTEYKAVK